MPFQITGLNNRQILQTFPIIITVSKIQFSLKIICIDLQSGFLHLLQESTLTLKVPSKICSRQHTNFFFKRENKSDISYELSAKHMIHRKCQDLFSLKKNNNNKTCLLQL